MASPRLNIATIKRDEIPTDAEESARMHKPVIAIISLPNDKKVTYDDLSSGWTAEQLKYRLSEENELLASQHKLYYKGEYLMEPLALFDFPSIANRTETGPIELTLKQA
jgi:hypothetical protein